MDNMSDAELKMLARGVGAREYVSVYGGVAVLDGEFTIEQLEAVIELLKRAQA